MANNIIAVDWGGTHVRACLLDLDIGEIGTIRHEKIAYVKGDENFDNLKNILGDWLRDYQHAPLYLCGMIGSREGWVDAGYVECPSGLDEIFDAVKIIEHEGRGIYFIPGIKSLANDGLYDDVMRGEETQILGVIVRDRATQILCLPGTHSKWAIVENAKIQQFYTFMTGELYKLMSQYSILRYSIASNRPKVCDAFHLGLTEAKADIGILSRLFSLRAMDIGGKFAANDAPSYLSGLLLGSEIQGALNVMPTQSITLVGDGAQIDMYETALKFFGLNVSRPDGDTAVFIGLGAIARMNKTRGISG
ncbi:MAG: hypothetical protein COB49_03115 [Alphaproteobacteria bacterium]|nr:MAG: hypothetical protein COB49_03115 [Alphaproteobacteria bacterium]